MAKNNDFMLGEITQAVKDIKYAILTMKELVERQDKRIAALESFRWLMAGGIALAAFLATFLYDFIKQGR